MRLRQRSVLSYDFENLVGVGCSGQPGQQYLESLGNKTD
jgi:hypothetical protein